MSEELIKRLSLRAGIEKLADKFVLAGLLEEAAAALSTPPAAVAVPDGMVLVRRKLIDESIARINCAIPGWEVHVHALNDALAAAPAAPSVRAVVVPAGIDRIGLHGFLCEALDDGRCIADAYRFKDGYHTARNAKVMALTDKLLAMLAAAPASPAATGWVKPSNPAATRQYYYHDDDCPIRKSGDPGCICWRDEGTGPFPNGTDIVQLSWRDKPAPSVDGEG
ncbi:MAG: hypothetical protein WA154_11120 [Moraxellaceae bacterium]